MWTPPTSHEYNPWNLPSKMDFHKATKDLPLPREMKVKFQQYLSSKNKTQIRQIVKELDDLMNSIFTRSGVNSKEVGYKKGNIIIPDNILAKQDEKRYVVSMAIMAKAAKDFAEKYLTSLQLQHKI